jgi:hypothetical protein
MRRQSSNRVGPEPLQGLEGERKRSVQQAASPFEIRQEYVRALLLAGTKQRKPPKRV